MSTLTVECPECKHEFEVEMPEPVKKQRGQLAGLTLKEMDDEQLKRELINANSVLYKAKQRNAADETIKRSEARVAAAKEEKALRAASAAAEKADETEEVYDEETEEVSDEI